MSSNRFIDRSPAHAIAPLLDDGVYLASERTFYRVLGADRPLRERRQQRRHPVYGAPELLATRPNQVWSWDITKLKGPVAGTWYHLYVILDLYSRYVVGWAVFDRESKTLARRLIDVTCDRQGIRPGELTIHADRGNAMRSTDVAELLAALGVRKSHSRPYCSNDNPYSESQFRTLKYSPEYPSRFGSLQDARLFGGVFFGWYNGEHRHSGIAMLPPSSVHHGHAEEMLGRRNEVLAEAYRRYPERFVKGVPKAGMVPSAVWINKPSAIVVAAGAESLN
ncbi:MAG: Integrase catalytic region [Chlorobi bacterium]|nr:Integrase catalytic region [Chlorobiota bacterium]